MESTALSPPTNPRSFDTVEIAPSSQNYGRKEDGNHRLSLPAFTAEATEESQLDKSSLLLDGSGTSKNATAVDEDREIDAHDAKIGGNSHQHGSGTKFGMFDGVLGRCLLCMWGVIMFLRTGWIVGQAGVHQATWVIVLSGSITFSTTLSLSAICTNGSIEHGGPYFLISRSLGPAFGAVIGVLFAIGNCIGVALHLTGFSEAITSLYTDPIMANATQDIVLWAELGLFFLLGLAWGGVGWIIRFNLMLLALMMISIVIFTVGTFTTKEDTESLGFTGYDSQTFSDNWGPAYQGGWDFLAMIGIFFPSVTGCMAGANISGDLKNPAHAIPVGTVIAVLFSLVVYIMIAWMLGATCLRESLDGTGGLYNDYVIMSNVSVWRPLVDMGIFASTFSSATSCFVAAPRIFKALCDDGLFPFLNFFAVGRKKDNEPVRVYLVVTAVCFVVMLSGDINFIAPVVTNFFLITYALINYSVFVWDTSKLAGWRPTFKYYSGYLSLFTSVACLALMFLIHWGTALITVICGGFIYKYIDNRDFSHLDWGTLTEAGMYDKACKIILKYQTIKQHAKNVRPTFLIFNYGSVKSERTTDTMELFRLCQCLNYSESLIVMGDVILGSLDDAGIAHEYMMKKLDFAKYNKDKNLTDEMIRQCVVETCVAKSFHEGCRNMLQLSGMGSMKPNIVIIKMGNDDVFLKDVNDPNKQPLWFNNFRDALITGNGVVMVRNKFSWEKTIDNVKLHFSDFEGVARESSNTSNFSLSKSKLVTVERPDGSIAHRPYIDVWWLFDDGGLTILVAYLLTKAEQFKHCKIRVMVLLDLVGLNQQTLMVRLMSKLRIDADIVEVSLPKDVKEKVDVAKLDTARSTSDAGVADLAGVKLDGKGDDADADVLASKPDGLEVISRKSLARVLGDDSGDMLKAASEAASDAAGDAPDGGQGQQGGDPNQEREAKTKDDWFDEQMNIHGSVKVVSGFAKKKIKNFGLIGETINKECAHSITSLCVLTIPFPRKKYNWWEYAAIIEKLTPGDVPTLLVRGNQEQVLTSTM